MSYIQVTKPHTTIPVKYKLDCKESVKNYLTEHGWKFKNNTSNDYLQNFYFTHKLVDGIGETWYKAHTNYTVEHASELWFRNGEIEWLEGAE